MSAGWPVRIAAVLAMLCGARAGAAPAPHPPPPPAAPALADPAWTTDERAVFEFVRARYVELGVEADLSTVKLVIDDHFVVPLYLPGQNQIGTMPFARDVAGARRHVATVSATLLDGLLVLDRFADDAALMRGYRALLVSSMAHELAHHIFFSRPGALDTTRAIDILDTETEAMEFELAFMDDLVARGDLDASWRDGVDAFYAAFDDAIPRANRLPDGHSQHAVELFTASYLTTNASFASLPPGAGTPAIDDSFRRFAGYLVRRAELTSGKRRDLAQLIAMANARLAAAKEP